MLLKASKYEGELGGTMSRISAGMVVGAVSLMLMSATSAKATNCPTVGPGDYRSNLIHA